ncbi:MAG: Methyltransferase type 11 [Acidimicrobiia bacterium]|nr:Methyltransferase type 11 [Acidimicrobiia bacterium]
MEQAEYLRMSAVEDAHWWYASTRRLLRTVLGPYVRPGGLCLDAGYGTGATGSWLGERATLVGADLEPQALTLAATMHPETRLAAADVTRLPFRDNSFDSVLCVTVLCHRSIPDPVDAAAELLRVLRPGGVICLMEPGVRRLRRAHDRVTHTGRRFSRADLAHTLTANGATIIRSTGAYSFLVPPAVAKAFVEREQVSSDLDRQLDGLHGLLPRAAAVEQRLLRRMDLPIGLSVLAIARKEGVAAP